MRGPSKRIPERVPSAVWRATLTTVLALALFLAGCAGDSSTGVAPPQPDLTQMEPQVRELLEQSRRAVLDDAGSAERWGKLGAAYDVHGLYAEAQVCYRRARELDPEEFRWAYFLALVLDVGGGDPDELVQAFEEAVRLRPDYPQAQFRLGHALSLRGSYEEAEQAYRAALGLDPQFAMAYRGLGQLLLARGESRAAVEALLVAAELSPQDGSVFSSLAQAFRRAGNPGLAEKAAARAARLEPINDIQDPATQYVAALGTSSMHWAARVRRQIDAGEYARAMEGLERLREITPADAHVLYLLGSVHQRLGRREDALTYLSRAVELDPDHLEARIELGQLLEAQGRIEEALGHYRHARSLAPDNTVLLISLAQALSRGGRDDSAVEIYLELEELGALDARMQSNWGSALTRLGRNEEAAERFREALRLDPEYANAYYNLGIVLEQLGRREEALGHFESAVRIEPNHVAGDRLRRLRSSGTP